MLKHLVNVSSRQSWGKKSSVLSLFAKTKASVESRAASAPGVVVLTLTAAGASYYLVDGVHHGKDEEVKQIIASIKEHEIYPKIYRLANGNIEARKALGYRIDPRMWTAWEYMKRLFQKPSEVATSMLTPLVRIFSLPVQGSKQNGILQVWASRQKVEDTWELERLELSFSPRESQRLNINANALQKDVSAPVADTEDKAQIDVSHTHDFDPSSYITEVDGGVTIVLWIDSGVPPRAQLEDPSVELASLPNMDDPWKLQLDDFEEPAVDYINED